MYTLGQKITVESQLKRISKFVQEGDVPWRTEYKVWDDQKLRQPIKGMVIGVRNLSNGKNCYEKEIGNVYTPKEYFKALIVVYKLSRKPILVKITKP